MGNDLSGKRPSAGGAINPEQELMDAITTLKQLMANRDNSRAINPVQELMNAMTHAASKIPLAARTDPDKYLPPGRLEATIAMIQWPPEPLLLEGDAIMVFDTHGGYVICSGTAPSMVIRRSGNIFEDAVDNLRRGESYTNQLIEFITRLNMINTKGQALFELTNKTLGVIPSRWTWRDLQGDQ